MSDVGVPLPTWLNHQYLEKVLRDSENNDKSLKLVSYNLSPAVAKGNNYASLIMRCLLKYTKNDTNKEKSVIIKAALENNELLDQFDSMNVEIAVYGRIFPRINDLLRSINDDTQLFPKTLLIDKEHRTIIFEDLKEAGYRIGDRHKGVDMDHVHLVIRKHAILHACSMVIKERYDEKFEEFRRGLYFEEAELWLEFVKTMFREFSEEIRTWEGYEKYAEKLNKMQFFVAEQACQMIKEQNEETSVFCHGDCWTANLMFKYENDHPKDLILIDFQEPIYGSPAFDFYYFIMTSTHDVIKFNYFHEIVQIYHGIFVEYLQKLKYEGKIPSLFEIQTDCVRKSFYGILSTIVIFTLMMNKDDENADLGIVMGTNEDSKKFRKKLFQSDKFMNTMKHFLPKWDAQGLLDKLH